MDEELILLAAIADWEEMQRRHRGAAGPQPVSANIFPNGYILEDASQYYITEDGSSVYVTE
jgi:hypothetical protein